LRNLGVREADLDDETQKGFLILSQRIDELEPSHVRSFLFGTARRVASHARRAVFERMEKHWRSILGVTGFALGSSAVSV
jgi:DNA-directed RNA polymerase specialized sigma24 family protein